MLFGCLCVGMCCLLCRFGFLIAPGVDCVLLVAVACVIVLCVVYCLVCGAGCSLFVACRCSCLMCVACCVVVIVC